MTYEELEKKHAKQMAEFYSTCKTDKQELETKSIELKTAFREDTNGDLKEENWKQVLVGLDDEFKADLFHHQELATKQLKEKTDYLTITKAFEAIKEFEDQGTKHRFERE